MVNLGVDLFTLAEIQLQKEVKEKIIPCYTKLDVIEYAILIRKWLDKNEGKIKKLTKFTKREIKRNKKLYRHRYYLLKGR